LEEELNVAEAQHGRLFESVPAAAGARIARIETMHEPVCPKCGGEVCESVSEFIYTAAQLPSLRTELARIAGYNCGCGNKFVVITYDQNTPIPRTARAPS
jgi:hypothetical protein